MFIDVDDDILVQNWKIQNFFCYPRNRKKYEYILNYKLYLGRE